MARRTLARRTPILAFQFRDEGGLLVLWAWEADDIGRIIDTRSPLTYARFDDEGPVGVTRRWFDSRDTDVIHALPELARDAVFDLDDAIRAAFKDGRLTRARP